MLEAIEACLCLLYQIWEDNHMTTRLYWYKDQVENTTWKMGWLQRIRVIMELEYLILCKWRNVNLEKNRVRDNWRTLILLTLPLMLTPFLALRVRVRPYNTLTGAFKIINNQMQNATHLGRPTNHEGQAELSTHERQVIWWENRSYIVIIPNRESERG